MKTVKEFVDYARNNAVSYANGGIGSPGHLLMELFKLKANFPAISVPYRGNAPLVVDLLSGEVKSGFVAAGGMIQNIRDGKLRGLAISTKERSPQLADVPTIAEAGYPEVLLGGYMVLHAPAGTLPAIVELLQKECSRRWRTRPFRRERAGLGSIRCRRPAPKPPGCSWRNAS